MYRLVTSRVLCLYSICLIVFGYGVAMAESIVAGAGWSAITVGKDFARLTEEIGEPENIFTMHFKGEEKTCYAQYLEGRIETIYRCQSRKILTIYFYPKARPWVKKSGPALTPTPAKNQPMKGQDGATTQFKMQSPNFARKSHSNFHNTLRNANSSSGKQEESLPQSLPVFTGTIEGGITLDSTIDTVIRKYGQPKKTDPQAVHYDGISFFRDGNGKMNRIAVYDKGGVALTDHSNRITISMPVDTMSSQGSLGNRKKLK